MQSVHCAWTVLIQNDFGLKILHKCNNFKFYEEFLKYSRVVVWQQMDEQRGNRFENEFYNEW